jgi:signal transduction histidine kinase
MMLRNVFLFMDLAICLLFLPGLRSTRFRRADLIMITACALIQVLMPDSVFNVSWTMAFVMLACVLYQLQDRVLLIKAIYMAAIPVILARAVIDATQMVIVQTMGFSSYLALFASAQFYWWMLAERLGILALLILFIRLAGSYLQEASDRNAGLILLITGLLQAAAYLLEQTAFQNSEDYTRSILILLLLLAADLCLPVLLCEITKDDRKRALTDEKVDQLRHDLRHLQQAAPEQQADMAAEYAREAEQIDSALHTDNEVLNQVLNRYRHMASEAQIDFVIVSSFAQQIQMSGNDLNCIVSNLLENALKYRSSGGSVLVRIRDQGSYVWLQVENDTDRDSCQEGTGLHSVRTRAERNQGSMMIEIRDGRFLVSVLMPARSSRGSIERSQRN